MPKFTSAYHDLALVCEAEMAADPGGADEWCRRALAAWQQARRLMQGDATYPQDYASTYIVPRIAWLKQQCGPENPADDGVAG
jgi:hypothetical protein